MRSNEGGNSPVTTGLGGALAWYLTRIGARRENSYGGGHLRWNPRQGLWRRTTVVRAPAGKEPSFYPNDVEAVWQLSDNCSVYIIEDPQRAGGAVNMVWVDDPVAEAARIAARGLAPDDVEKHDGVWKYVFHDADGNETGIGGEVVSVESAKTSGRLRAGALGPPVSATGLTDKCLIAIHQEWPGREGRSNGRQGFQ